MRAIRVTRCSHSWRFSRLRRRGCAPPRSNRLSRGARSSFLLRDLRASVARTGVSSVAMTRRDFIATTAGATLASVAWPDVSAGGAPRAGAGQLLCSRDGVEGAAAGGVRRVAWLRLAVHHRLRRVRVDGRRGPPGDPAAGRRQEAQDSARHVEHRPDVEGLQAEVGLCRGTSGAWDPGGQGAGIADPASRAGHLRGPALRRRHRASHRAGRQGLPVAEEPGGGRRREDRRREPCRRHALDRAGATGRGRRQGLRRREPRFRQRAMDPGGSDRQPSHAGPLRADHQPS